METYKTLAAKARDAERQGEFSEARSIWKKAYLKASEIDREWVSIRINFCSRALKNSWGAWT